jgi:hypothetical protein
MDFLNLTTTPTGETSVGNDKVVTPPPATPAPFNANFQGVTDGTSVATASKNMAWLYNGLSAEIINTIKAAGIVPDKNNWAQLQAAITSIASGAVPDATDTVKGKVALNAGTAATDATNATDALTAAGLAAILNGTAPNPTPNALQAAVGSNPSQYGTLAGVGAPTAAPSLANPATEITNANGEVFRWNGTGWYLSGNGFYQEVQPPQSGSFGPGFFNLVFLPAMPRSGQVSINFNGILGDATTSFATGLFYLIKNGAIIARFGGQSGPAIFASEASGAYVDNCSAGDLFGIQAQTDVTVNVAGISKLSSLYIK